MALEAAKIALRKANGVGVRFDTGKPTATQITHKEAYKVIAQLEREFAMRGCFSFSVCKTCSSWNPACNTSKAHGQCNGKTRWAYDTCSAHSPGPDNWGGNGGKTV